MKESHDFEFKKNDPNISSCYTIGILLERDMKILWRNPLVVKSRLIQAVFTGIYMGGLWFRVGDEDYTNPAFMQAITGFIYFYILSVFM